MPRPTTAAAPSPSSHRSSGAAREASAAAPSPASHRSSGGARRTAAGSGRSGVVARIAPVRAVVALLWAAALVVAIGGDGYATAAELPAGIAALLAAYPLVNAVASLVEAGAGAGRSTAVLRVDAALSVAAAAGLAVAAFAGDAGATVAVFGAWAVLSGAIQLGVALSRRASTPQWPMIVSGTLSTLAGIAFAASATGDTANLANLAGYAAMGAVLYLVWAVRARGTRRHA